MSLAVGRDVIEKTSADAFKRERDSVSRFSSDRDVVIQSSGMPDEALQDLMAAAKAVSDSKTVRAIESVLLARQGNFSVPIPNFKALEGVLRAFFKHNLIEGWIYVEGEDGQLYPELITEISYEESRRGNDAPPTVTIKTVYYGRSSDGRNGGTLMRVERGGHTFLPTDVARRRVADVLAKKGLYKETAELKQNYEDVMRRHGEVTLNAFSKQFRACGRVNYYETGHYQNRNVTVTHRRVIHDLEASNYAAMENHVDSVLMDGAAGSDGMGQVPEHPVVRVFDLKSHDFYWMHSSTLEPYKYDKTLGDKLVLPESHRDLLDVLTTDIECFVSDIIEGKSAGNVILCKGIPGVGKTLTAEVYAELIEKPLYCIHSGTLGTKAQEIEKSLERVFKRAKRWDCTLLLDEADVFVVQRGGNIEQNAIVAEFLRTLEYFDGLIFLTTNRPSDIDEAIISRCAAIIGYEVPQGDAVAKVWKVMAEQYKAELPDQLVAELLRIFPKIAPRDIKMLLRLALRVSTTRKEPLTVETFRRCAMFRAVEMGPA